MHLAKKHRPVVAELKDDITDSINGADEEEEEESDDAQVNTEEQPDNDEENDGVEEEEESDKAEEEFEEQDAEVETGEDVTTGSKKRKRITTTGALSVERLQKFREENEKKGVVYLSRIPPYMRPIKLRHLLSQYGDVLRIYLEPEPTTKRQKRKQRGGNKKVRYTEGWVEFADKDVAQMVAENLNNQPVGGKKNSFFYSDIWNMKYLPGFKWQHLSEKKTHERATQKKKLRTELAQVKRENNSYLQKVEQAKMQRHIEERKLKQQKRTAKAQRKAQPRSEEDSAQQEEARPEPTNQLSALKQKFRQRRTHNEPQLAKKSAEKRDTKRQRAEKQGQNDDREDGGGDKGEVSDELLMQIFGKA